MGTKHTFIRLGSRWRNDNVQLNWYWDTFCKWASTVSRTDTLWNGPVESKRSFSTNVTTVRLKLASGVKLIWTTCRKPRVTQMTITDEAITAGSFLQKEIEFTVALLRSRQSLTAVKRFRDTTKLIAAIFQLNNDQLRRRKILSRKVTFHGSKRTIPSLLSFKLMRLSLVFIQCWISSLALIYYTNLVYFV